MSDEVKVVAVVVAFNRRELLGETLAALQSQTRPLDGIVVVDNGSDDGSGDMVSASFPDVTLVTLERNTGGAGGFAVGIERAVLASGADRVWIMDDDTVPSDTALAALLVADRRAPVGTDVLGSRVVWTDGREHPMNMPRRKPFASRATIASAERNNAYPVRSASFVSLMVTADAVRRHGLPIAEYFLWNDDFEYTMRILRRANGFIVRDSLVVHKTKVFGGTDADPGERFYLEVRNKVWLLRHSPALTVGERVLYTGATVRRWTRTFVRSSNRAVLWECLRRGLRDGFGRGPLGNAETLGDLPVELVDGQRVLAPEPSRGSA